MIKFSGNNTDNTANHIKNIYNKNKAKARQRQKGLGRIFGKRVNPAND